jgi:beta-lactamase superfamily II metal-dependent hydrolase
MNVYFIDVGQGDATLITTADGHSMLVDGGRSMSLIRDRLETIGIDDLDAIVATHADPDHLAASSRSSGCSRLRSSTGTVQNATRTHS